MELDAEVEGATTAPQQVCQLLVSGIGFRQSVAVGC